VTLFSRTGRRLELTEAGAHVHRWAAETLSRTRTMLRAVGEIENGERGTAFICASMSVGSYVLPTMLTAFRSARPQTHINLTIREPEAVLRAVEQGECDFGISVLETPPANPNLLTEVLAQEEIVLVAAPDGPPHVDAIRLSDVGDIPLIAPPVGTARRHLMDAALAALGARLPESILDLGHPEAMKRAARTGAGATFLFRSAVTDELERGDLRSVRLIDTSLTIPIYAIRHAARPLSAVQNRLLDAVRAELANSFHVPAGVDADEPSTGKAPIA
jgi:DNA-binding transcriptional LysR family regulator